MVLALTFCASLAHAAPVSCDIEGALSQMLMDPIQRQGDVAGVDLSLTNELAQIGNKAKIAGKPIGDQLGAGDQVRFTELSAHLKANQISEIVLSDRERDLSLALSMFGVAQSVRDGHRPDPADQDGVDVLAALEQTLTLDKYEEPVERGGCGVDVLLYAEEQATLADAASADRDVDADMAATRSIEARYGVTKIVDLDPKRLTAEDRSDVDRIRGRLSRLQTQFQYAKDLEIIREWLKASDLVVGHFERDVVTYPGMGDKLETSLDADYRSMNFAERRRVGMWGVINDKYPSTWRRQMTQIADAMTGLKTAEHRPVQVTGAAR